MIYDLIRIGAGPAGLSAALTARYLRLNHLVLDADTAGGVLSHTYPWKEVDSFIGFYEETGQEVADLMVSHVKKEGAAIKECEEVKKITRDEKKKIFRVKTCKGFYETKTILIATGTAGTPRKLEIPGESNPNVLFSIAHPKNHKGKRVLVVGGGDTALESALVLKKAGADVYLAHRKDEFRAMEKTQEHVKKSKVKILLSTELKEIFGKKKIEKVRLLDNKTNKESFLKVDEIFVFIGSVFDMGFIKDLGIKIEGDKIPAHHDMATNVEGVFAAGDITGRLKRIPEAIGEGHLAVYSIYKYLKKPYWA